MTSSPSPRRSLRVGSALLALVLSIGLLTTLAPARRADAAAPASEAWQFLALTNQTRQAHGLPPLAMQPTLVDIATGWTQHMAASGTLSHNLNLAPQVAGSGMPDWQGVAENVGVGSDVPGLQQAFLNSPGHLANILGNYNYVGIATAYDGSGRIWVTLDFLRIGRALATISPMSLVQAVGIVKSTYADFFGRTASASEVSYWAGGLASGAVSLGQYLQAVVTSPEWLTTIVDRLYVSTLGRGPDAGGAAFWVGELRAGLTPAAAAASFYGSPEYYSRSGGTPGSFVRALYSALLSRSADSGGLSYWSSDLSSGEPLTQVAYTFYQSVESRSLRVRTLYQQLLGRAPDAAGLNYWIGQLGDGNDLRLALSLAASPEYLQRSLLRAG